MKAKTKLQIRVVDLSENKLPKITLEQKNYGREHNLDHKAFRLKSGKITCLDCGHSWQSKSLHAWHDQLIKSNCPSCNVKLKIETTRKKKHFDWSYMGIVTTCEEFQVIRTIKVHGRYFSGKPVDLSIHPVSEIWIHPNGKFEIVGFNHRISYGGEGGWWTGDWCLKSRDHLQSHCIAPYKMFPKKKVNKEIRRNGFRNSFYDISPYTFIKNILKHSEIETLLKAKQISLFRDSCLAYNNDRLLKRWKSVKIAMRNNFLVTDAQMWYDYLDLVDHFQGNTLDPKIVCNKDYKKEHNRLMHKKAIIYEAEQEERNRLRSIYQEKEAELQKVHFAKTCKLFSSFKIQHKSKDLNIVAFTSEEQVRKEGIILDHCIHVNQYYLKLNSILLSARFNGIVMETIQICLKSYTVIACRGYDNLNSKYHKDILKLINNNLNKIKRTWELPKTRKHRKPKDEMIEASA